MIRVFTLVFLLTISIAAHSATFTSIASGNYTASGTWSQSGSDGDGVPDQDDDVILAGGFTVSLIINSHCRNITINPGATLVMNSFTMLNYGSCTQNGLISGVGSWQFRGAGTYTGNNMNYQGTLYFYSNYTIAAGVTITKNVGAIIIGSGCVITNNGSVSLNSTSNGYLQFISGTSRWINAANSSLTVSRDFIGTGILTATASPNTVHYKANSAGSIKATTYHHLVLGGTTSHTKTLLGATTVNGNMTINASVTLNWAGNSINLFGNWTNNANTTGTNLGQITFSGTGTQTITRATGNTEVFGSMIVGGSGTVQLADSLRTNSDLTINSGTLDVTASNFNVHVRGGFQDNSVFNARQGTFFMDGSAAQLIDGIATTSFYNLTISNAAGVTVDFTKQITNILSVQAGAFGPSGFGSIVLTATGPTTYARIGPLGATASLSGSSWLIQSYINGPATAYWQYLTPPTNGPTLQDWDGDTRFYMSGVGGNDGTACCPTFFSVRTYNTTTNTYANVTSVNTVLARARGYMVWMADNLNSLTAPLVFDTRGTPNFGAVNRAVVAGGSGNGYNLVGNPYPCPVTFSNVVAASSATLSANFVILQEDGTYATNPNGGTIAPAQGFMCVATTAGNISFTESCKTTSVVPNVIRETRSDMVRVRTGNAVNGLGEEITIQLDANGDQSYDSYLDLPYLPSPYDNATHLWSSNDNGDQFLLNNIGTTTDHLMIPMTVVTSTIGTQTLTFKDLNTVSAYNCAWLEDLATGARFNLNQSDVYSFDESELGTTRNFILHFERTNDCLFDLNTTASSLEAQTNVFVSSGQVFASFDFADEQMVTVSMYDLGGRMIMAEAVMNVSRQTVALQNPDAHGVYLLRIQRGNEFVTKKFYY